MKTTLNVENRRILNNKNKKPPTKSQIYSFFSLNSIHLRIEFRMNLHILNYAQHAICMERQSTATFCSNKGADEAMKTKESH